MAAHAHAHDDHDGDEVYFQYEDIGQQQESYVLGMWSFLVTEVMFFGALFFIYFLYRTRYGNDFQILSHHLRWDLGGINTMILLFSSFTMALAVHFAQVKKKGLQLTMLGVTMLCAFGFLGVKAIEYGEKFRDGLVPNNNFKWHYHYEANPDVARMFYSLYFTMTGLHGVHVVIGIICIGSLMYLIARNKPVITDYIPTEMIGLYWHFVDLVWIFLYPFFYLIPK
jgi:cytochrome c oxidase subunit 3